MNEYVRNHARVVKAFGKASTYQCWLCFDPATAWAWLWRTHPDPTNPWSYLPLCTQDHSDYDRDSPAKIRHRERLRKLWADPEYRARQAKGHQRQREDPQYRAKQSAKARKPWTDPEYRIRQTARTRDAWQDPEKRARMMSGMPMAERGRISRTRVNPWDRPEYRERMTARLVEYNKSRRNNV